MPPAVRESRPRRRIRPLRCAATLPRASVRDCSSRRRAWAVRSRLPTFHPIAAVSCANIPESVAERLASRGARAVVLTGSVARGTASPDSDVDLFALPTRLRRPRLGVRHEDVARRDTALVSHPRDDDESEPRLANANTGVRHED